MLVPYSPPHEYVDSKGWFFELLEVWPLVADRFGEPPIPSLSASSEVSMAVKVVVEEFLM